MKRLAIAFFYDDDGIIDDYYVYLLRKMRDHCGRLVLVVNGHLTERSQAVAEDNADAVIVRANVGFDVWAYKAGLDFVGFDTLEAFDEILLFNHTFFGPIYPLAEMFGAMAGRACDFWGMTAHKAVPADPAINREAMAYHLNSHFVAVRRSMATSAAFRAYWADMVPIPTYQSSILLHEIVFTAHFERCGFVSSSYVDPDLYGSDYSAFIELDETLLRSRSPILKRRPFFHDPLFMQERGIDLPRALRVVEETSDYPVALIWQNIVRATNARTLHTNAALMEILPEDRPAREGRRGDGRIAVCVHAFYDDLVPEILDRAAAIPGRYDLIVTTDTAEKKARIEAMARGRPNIDDVFVLVTASRGRDMGALLVACHDLMTSGRYDLVCRVHTKKSPQVDSALGNLFKRHTLNNVLPGRSGVTAILDLFAANSRLGMVMPPMVHIGYPTFGHAWFVNRRRTEAVAALLNIRVPLDDFSPMAAYGGMFWFRPQALARVFAGWQWEDFEGEPHPIDGALAHALERILVYAAMDEGYVVKTALGASDAARNYAVLEFKHNMVAGLLPTGNPRAQAAVLAANRAALRDAHRTGQPLLAPAEGRALRKTAEREVEAARLLADERRRICAEDAASVMRLEAACRALLATGKAGAFAERVRRDTRTIRAFLAAIALDGEDGAPDDEHLASFVLSHRDPAHRLTPLFDAAWYARTYPDSVASGANPLVHFITAGWAEGNAPHPLFSTAFYRAERPARAAPDDVALRAYRHQGARARDAPHPLFDPIHYGEQSADAAAQVDLLAHYLTSRESRRSNPHPLFDTAFYLAESPGVAALSVTPLVHFVTNGWREHRDPHPLFDTDYYLSQAPDLSALGLDPLSHFITTGWRKGLNPHPLFDTRYYLDTNDDVRAAGFNPLVHFVLYGAREGRNPHSFFDMTFYCRSYPDVAQSGANPLIHYLTNGDRGDRHPHRGFDGRSYLADNPDVASAGFDPLVHFLRWGRGEHRRIRPLSSTV